MIQTLGKTWQNFMSYQYNDPVWVTVIWTLPEQHNSSQPLGSLGSHLTIMNPRPLTAQCGIMLLWSFGWTTWNLGCWARMNSTTQFRWSTRPSVAFPMQLLGSSLRPIVHLTGGAACEKSSGYRGGRLGPRFNKLPGLQHPTILKCVHGWW